MIPTADQAALIIVAAFGECRADPLTVADSFKGVGTAKTGAAYRSLCGRRYSAIVMRRLFPACPNRVIGRMVGCRGFAADALVGELTASIAKGKASWFDPEALARIIVAVGIEKSRAEQVVIDETEKSIRQSAKSHRVDPHIAVEVSRREGAPSSRPAVSERQRAAARMLEEAVRNTAALTNGASRAR